METYSTKIQKKDSDEFSRPSDLPDEVILHIGEQFDPTKSDLARKDLPPLQPLQVEILLDQAARLLDRALHEDELRRRMAIEYFNLTLDNWEYQKLDAINSLEVTYGVDSIALNEATAAADGEDALHSWKKTYEGALKEDAEQRKKLAGWSMENSLDPFYRPSPGTPRALIRFGGYTPATLDKYPSQINTSDEANAIGAAVAYDTAGYEIKYQTIQASGEADASKKRGLTP